MCNELCTLYRDKYNLAEKSVVYNAPDTHTLSPKKERSVYVFNVSLPVLGNTEAMFKDK